MGNTSIGPDTSTGGNENHGSDGCGNKTLGELSSQVPPSGKDLPKTVGKARPEDTDAQQKEAAKGKPAKG